MPVERVPLAMTGAPYGLRLLQCLLERDLEVFLILSKAARVVVGMETELALPNGSGKTEQALREHVATDRGRLVVCGLEQWTSPVASGSGAPAAMVDFVVARILEQLGLDQQMVPRWGEQ